MCGIAGIVSPDPAVIREDQLEKMALSLKHRGPDGQVCWKNESGNAGFAHTRLCVIDTSDAASQPMHYGNRYTIVHNGEIYNYLEIKEELQKKGYSFNTFSDTEVILIAYACYREDCVQYFDGMFSFAIWDEQEQSLFCARDRFGEKPFYYWYDEQKKVFYFGSEMKSLTAAGVDRMQNNSSLLRFLTLGHTFDPTDTSVTSDERIRKLPASHWLRHSLKQSSISIRQYWDIPLVISRIPLDNAIIRLNELLSTSVNRRLRSDVSLGASISGGLDSSSIAFTIARMLQKNNFKTFTASFPGFEKDETAVAGRVAERLGFRNFSTVPSAEGFVADFEKLVFHHEEPFSSSSVYAQYKLFELASEQNVTVLLDGQGADEVIGGYDKYLHWRLHAVFPVLTSGLLRNREKKRVEQDKYINKDFIAAHRSGISYYKPVVRSLNDLLYYNTVQAGLEELLRYADRNSMAHGREVRLPFLNHELVTFIFSLPSAYKVHDGFTKWILRKAMTGKLPSDITWKKKKTGFEPPQRQWMMHPVMKEYIHEAKKELVKQGVLTEDVLKAKPVAHNAYDKENPDWRWLVAGTMMAKNKKGV